MTRPEEETVETIVPETTGNDANNNSGENNYTELNSETTETHTRKSNRTKKPPNRLGGVPYIKNFLGKIEKTDFD